MNIEPPPIVTTRVLALPTARVGAAAAGVVPATPAEAARSQRIEPTQALDRSNRPATRLPAGGHEVEVTGFHDPGAGRFVVRVADRRSGDVLIQSPPDALLRFFAAARAALAEPRVVIDA